MHNQIEINSCVLDAIQNHRAPKIIICIGGEDSEIRIVGLHEGSDIRELPKFLIDQVQGFAGLVYQVIDSVFYLLPGVKKLLDQPSYEEIP